MKLQFLGDISLDGLYCDPQQADNIKNNMAFVDKELGSIDARIANWESPLWGNGEINKLKFPRLCTTLDAAKNVLPLNISHLVLANNHVYDCGVQGFKNTIKFFNDNSIGHTGASLNSIEPIIIEKDGISVCVLSYVGEETNPKLPDECEINVNIINDKLQHEISEVKNKYDYIILYLHWGEEELVRIPSLQQRKMARGLIDSGVDIIVGSHVHCLQGWERWNNGIILYSLGNFLFGPQLVIPGKIDSKRSSDNRNVAIAEIQISETGLNLSWKYFQQQDNGLTLLRNENLSKIHDSLSKRLKYNDFIHKLIYSLDCKLSPFRNFIDKNGGIMKSIFSIEIKHFLLLKKVLLRS